VSSSPVTTFQHVTSNFAQTIDCLLEQRKGRGAVLKIRVSAKYPAFARYGPIPQVLVTIIYACHPNFRAFNTKLRDLTTKLNEAENSNLTYKQSPKPPLAS
jgi:hypothetical protein